MQQKTAKFRGLGFVVGRRLIPHVRSWWHISDRVAVINIAIPNKSGHITECLWTNNAKSNRKPKSKRHVL